MDGAQHSCIVYCFKDGRAETAFSYMFLDRQNWSGRINLAEPVQRHWFDQGYRPYLDMNSLPGEIACSLKALADDGPCADKCKIGARGEQLPFRDIDVSVVRVETGFAGFS